MIESLRYAVIEITNRCNLRCAHCASTSGAARDNELSLAEITQLLADIRALGGEEITIIGGEALMRDDWPAICQTVRDLGMRLILISNGLLIRSDETFAIIKRLQPHVVGISLDGASRETYRVLRGVDGFDHCMGVLRRLLAEGHKEVNAITTVMRSNINEFDDFLKLLDNTGITWQIQIANRGGKRFEGDQFITREQYAWLTAKMREVIVTKSDTFRLRHMDDFGYFPLDPALRFLHQTFPGCIAGRRLIGVRSNGDIMGCLSLGDDFVEANIRATPLAQIWQGAPGRDSTPCFNRFRHKQDHLTGHCRDCPFAAACRAGCTAVAHSATGEIGCNPYCMRQIEVEEILGEACVIRDS